MAVVLTSIECFDRAEHYMFEAQRSVLACDEIQKAMEELFALHVRFGTVTQQAIARDAVVQAKAARVAAQAAYEQLNELTSKVSYTIQ